MTRKIFFTADTHFGHKNILLHCKRPFKDVEQMDRTLIRNWNDLVSVNDVVYHLGDFAWKNMKAYRSQLFGEIHLIKGSHDKDKGCLEKCFASVSDIKEITIEKDLVVLCHYAMRTWRASHYNSIQLYAHSHGRLKPEGKQWDVGVDNNNFRPISWEEVKRIMDKQPDNFNYSKRERKGGRE